MFLENWQLAADAVDYAARSNMSSPVQHFWSLSIQGQFFFVWPLLVALVALAARGEPTRVREHLTVTTLGVFAASLMFSVALTATNQPLAYFHSLTRLWEFALGGLLALTIDNGPAAAADAGPPRLDRAHGAAGVRRRAARGHCLPRDRRAVAHRVCGAGAARRRPPVRGGGRTGC